MKVIKIPFDNKIPCTVCEVPEPDEDGCLDSIKKLIDIEWVEIVVTIERLDPTTRRDFCLLVDEVGKLHEGWEQEVNFRASRLYAGSLYGDPIVGDVVLCARQWTDSFGECDLSGLTDAEIAYFLRIYLYSKKE